MRITNPPRAAHHEVSTIPESNRLDRQTQTTWPALWQATSCIHRVWYKKWQGTHATTAISSTLYWLPDRVDMCFSAKGCDLGPEVDPGWKHSCKDFQSNSRAGPCAVGVLDHAAVPVSGLHALKRLQRCACSAHASTHPIDYTDRVVHNRAMSSHASMSRCSQTSRH